MHEAAIISNVVTRQPAEGALPGRVRAVRLRVGKLVAAVPDNLRFLFDVLTRDTPLEGAALEIEEVGVKIRCRSCGAEDVVDDHDFGCRSCRSSDAELTEGREMIVDSVEVNA